MTISLDLNHYFGQYETTSSEGKAHLVAVGQLETTPHQDFSTFPDMAKVHRVTTLVVPSHPPNWPPF